MKEINYNNKNDIKIGIMQPYFFPYIGYWQLLAAVDRYVVYDDVNYIKGGWIARNNILLNGAKHLITLPLDNPSPFKIINEIAITNNMKAREKIVRTIKNAYLRAPYFNLIIPIVENLIMYSKTIAELNYNAIIRICDYLGIETEIIVSSNLDKNNGLKGEEKVIHIVKKLGGNTYYNAIGGRELYDRKNFAKEGIKLSFIKTGDVTYQQFNNNPVSGLSIIDVLMFNSVEEVKQMLEIFDLV